MAHSKSTCFIVIFPPYTGNCNCGPDCQCGDKCTGGESGCCLCVCKGCAGADCKCGPNCKCPKKGIDCCVAGPCKRGKFILSFGILWLPRCRCV